MPVPTRFGVLASRSSFTTLNPADKSSLLTLSNGNLRAAKNSGSFWVMARATTSKAAGKWYFEATTIVTVASVASNGDGVGVANGSAALDGGNFYLGNDNNSCGVLTDGALRQGGPGGLVGGSAWGTAGDVCCIAIDLNTRTIWFRKGPAGIWNGSGAANPATGVGGYALAAPLNAGAIFPAICACVVSTPDTVQVNFGASAFSGAIPSGFSAWG